MRMFCGASCFGLGLSARLQPINRETASKFFGIRHLTRRRNGLIVVICHRLHGLNLGQSPTTSYSKAYQSDTISRLHGFRRVLGSRQLLVSGRFSLFLFLRPSVLGKSILSIIFLKPNYRIFYMMKILIVARRNRS